MHLKLYHISENGNIKLFEPRQVIEKSHKLANQKVVWAINEEKLINYLFPRDCPRIIYYLDEDTNDADRKELFSHHQHKKVVVIESEWVDRIINAEIYKYTLESVDFELFDEVAGYYISKKAIVPSNCIRIGNLLREILKENVEMRIVEKMVGVADRVKNSTVKYSIIRLRNAK